MYSAPRSILAVALLFMSCLSGTVAFPQGVNFIRRVADPLSLANALLGRAPCKVSGDVSATCDTPPVSVPSVNACNPATLTQVGCKAQRDLVHEDLAAMGKPGQKILRARERVLEILQTKNACSAWFRGKDPNPAATFRTLNFRVDGQAEDFVLQSKGPGSLTVFRNPYVAKVFQDDGAYATVTINKYGAFFTSMASVVEVWKEGGPVDHRAPRSTDVGPYAGDTVHAQVLVLLHEFGHLLDLLPTDEDNLDGKSVQNTSEVLRFCRAQIESKVRRDALVAAR